jgi:outer membrane protein assembly factor BamB
MRYLICKHLIYLPVATFVLGLLAVGWWIGYRPLQSLGLSLPGADGYIPAGQAEENIIIGEHFQALNAMDPVRGESWPGFRGAYHDNIYRNRMPLVSNFSQGGNEILWSVSLGEGHAGPAIWDGLVYLLDYDEEKRADMLRCFSLETGREIWRRWYDVHIRRNHGMSRTVPAVTREFILTLGPRGHIMCLDRESGDLLWAMDLEKDWGTEIPLWYTGQCPLIDNGVAVIAPGGDALMIGVDCATGEVLWETPNPGGWEMSHSSVIPYTFEGKKMYVYSAIGGALGVAADGPLAGEILWKVPQWNHRVIAASPVGMPDGKIFLTAGYGAGSMVLQLHAEGGVFKAEILETFRPGEGLSSEQQTPVYAGGHLFGVLPKDARTMRNQFVCVDPADFTSFVWTSGSTARFGLGPFILADNKFYLLDDDGTLYIIEMSLQEFRQLDSMQIIDNGHDAWAPLAVADGYLLLRDSHTMVCIDIKRQAK